MSRRVWLPILLVVACVPAGCGSGDDTSTTNAYVRSVNQAQDRFDNSVDRLQRSISSSSTTPAQDRRTLTRLSVAVDGVVAELRRIDVPAKVKQLHQRLVAAVASYRPVIRSRRAAVGAGDPRKLLVARTAFSSGSQDVNDRVQRAISAINAQLQK